MKKAKIMLMAIAILGVLGGALAFKAKSSSFISAYMCYTTNTLAAAPTCTLGAITQLTFVPGTPAGIKYSFVNTRTLCTVVTCPTTAKTTQADAGQ